MPTITRKVVFSAVRAKFAAPAQRKALSQKLGKPWNYASTEALAQAVGLQSAPRKASAKGSARAKSTTKQHGFARSFASENAAKNLSDNETKRSLIKGRLVRSVKRAVTAKEKDLGRKLDPKEKKIIAAKAFGAEVKAIRSGVPETKGRQKATGKKLSVVTGGQKTKGEGKAKLTSVDGGNQSLGDLFKAFDHIGSKYQDENDPADLGAKRKAKQFLDEAGITSLVDRAKGGSGLRALDGGKGKTKATVTDIGSKSKKPKSTFSHTPPPGVSVADHRAALRRQHGAESGSRTEQLSRKEQQRAEVARAERGSGRATTRRVADSIPFSSTTTATKLPAKRLDGKLNSDQQKAIASHLRKVKSGDASSVPLRALQDSSGQHWLEMKSKTGRVGAVPIDAKGKKDNDRAVHSGAWEKKSQSMNTISKFPASREPKAKKVLPSRPPALHEMTEAAFRANHPHLAPGEAQEAQAQAIAAALHQGKRVPKEIVRLFYDHPAVEDFYEQINRRNGQDTPAMMIERLRKPAKPKPVKAEVVTRGTKTTPFAGTNAPLKAQPKATMVRGRSID